MKKLLIYTLSSLLIVFGIVSIGPAVTHASPTNSYVALGDSVASGAGLPFNGTDPDAVKCQRSGQAYPFVVARSIGATLDHEACGGAKITEGLLKSQNAQGTPMQPQLDQAFAAGTPRVISITAGTNDIGWSTYLTKCHQADCGNFSDTASSSYLIWRVHQNMRSVLNEIAARSGTDPKPTVIITGYYLPVSNAQPACMDKQGLTTKEVDWIRQQASLLNIALNAMAYEYDFVKFASVDFSGHELCSADPWIQGITGPAFYHPTAKGQEALGKAVIHALR